MKKFTASLTKSGTPRIISVFAEDIDLARAEIWRQLGKPGRQDIRSQWERNGGHITETTNEFAQ